ncbi:hypothetical protein N7493_002913 [Penicillium malachiteum]|uniref:Uncharacterized protein n=1 Tax=Penicillium malachiteum TaxID=1324776 RepID=A0AAD6MZ79_9EURO|nr:hypothetical protein N7493_002913 [Penicillium malachiteum]
MRLHLIISRHGLPATRVLWTTAAGGYGSHGPAPTSAIASSRTPNIVFANGGYTIAQLLEDVNEVVPLETEPNVFDPEFSGQWGLEDYVVEVGGSECLHFMEIEGLLRDGDEVVIRALQLADLRARRLCGRHQITSDGKHLIDGVPFGLPFKHRNTSHRPAVTIPPRKKRRTVLSGWDQDPGYTFDNPNPDEEGGDGEWLPPSDTGFGKELSILPTEHDMSLGTVIRHPVDHSPDEDSDDAEDYEMEEDELESELEALKADFQVPASQFLNVQPETRRVLDSSILRPNSAGNRPDSSSTQGKASLVGASYSSSKRSRGDYSSPRTSKAVRFNKGDDLELPQQIQPTKVEIEVVERSAVSCSQSESDSDSDSSDSSSDSDSDSDMSSSESEAENSSEENDSSEEEREDSDVTGSSSSSSSSSEDSSSEEDSSDEESDSPAHKKVRLSIMAPPGQGSIRTKKSNNRYKLRRRLSKLKEIGVLPAEADFAALRSWEEQNGGWHYPEESSIMSNRPSKSVKQEQEQREFEARRQKLLNDLASGGVDVEEASEKENMPPRTSTVSEPAIPEPSKDEAPEPERSSRRTLDIASSRRLIFGPLGLRAPKTKEDKEATRIKLAAMANKGQRKKPIETPPVESNEEEENDGRDSKWQEKLIISATECMLPDITLTAPPFPFVNRWDKDANDKIRAEMGWGKKRKRKQRIQVYDGCEDQDYEDYQNEGDTYGDHSNWEETELYDNEELEAQNAPSEQAAAVDDLPSLPKDPSSLADLLECEAKPGAIIAFRQLDMSKDTNWQPRMSEYRVAEVHKVEQGNLHVQLAVRDRKPKKDDYNSEDDEPREYSGFEMPGFDDDEGDDEGFRELAFAELSDPKLLKSAPSVHEEDNHNNNAQEGSIVSIVEDSMPNAQLAPPVADMDLDETTFVTLVTANESPVRLSDIPSIPSIQTPGGRLITATRGQDADDERSDSPVVPSPSFSGFHSARSSPGMAMRFHNECDESNILDGHTLIEEAQTTLADISNQDFSGLSFLSANQSFSNDRSQSEEQHDRQVVEESQAASGGNTSGSNSLLQMQVSDGANLTSSKAPSVQSVVEESLNVEREDIGRASQAWSEITRFLHKDQSSFDHTDQDKEELEDDTDGDQDDGDSLLHSNQSPDPSPRPSSFPSSSHSSRRPPPSAQRQTPSQSQSTPTNKTAQTSKRNTESPAASTRSKRNARPVGSQISASQMSEVIDLTSSPAPDSQPIGTFTRNASAPLSKPGADDSILEVSGPESRSSTSKVQRMTEVSIRSPTISKKSKKKRLSRKF